MATTFIASEQLERKVMKLIILITISTNISIAALCLNMLEVCIKLNLLLKQIIFVILFYWTKLIVLLIEEGGCLQLCFI